MKHESQKQGFRASNLISAIAMLLLSAGTAFGLTGNPFTYTTTPEFKSGSLINVTADAIPDQLQLLETGEAFSFIWVAASARGTIVKIDTEDGTILGEYRSAPTGRARNPSRTTVDANGNVWAGNRDESFGGQGSVVHIGLEENGQCIDRNGNGTIETSSGLGNILAWENTGGADDNGGVSTAVDECIIHYVRTSGTNVRTVAIDGSNNVWVGGLGNRSHELYDSNGDSVLGSQFNLGCGGYGGLVDGNGILWSATFSPVLLRYDPASSTGACIPLGRTSYGLGIDTNGFIWHSNYNYNTVQKIDPAGVITGPFPTGGASNDRGVAVTPADNHVWIANSGGSDVSRLDNNGVLKTVIRVGNLPTGIAVDAAGKVWVTNYSSDNVMRIDPTTNTVDLVVFLGAGARPYNYSDMTGSTLTAAPDNGTWAVDHDSGMTDAPWSSVSWTSSELGDSSIVVTVASSNDGVTFSPSVTVSNGGDPAVPDGQYLRIRVAFTRSTNSDSDGNGINDSPILFDLTTKYWVDTTPPECALTNVIPGPPTSIEVTTSDAGSGLDLIEVLVANNATVVIPAFSPGTTDPVIVTATKINQSTSAQVALQVTDVAGNVTECDPVITLVVREDGKPVSETFTDLPAAESNVTVTNGDPGVKNLDVIVNGTKFKVTALGDGDLTILDVSSAMVEGNNTITLTGYGKPGSSATVVVSD